MKSLYQFIIEEATGVNGFAILKPGFLDHEEDWLKMLDNNNWKVVQKKKFQLTHDAASELYKNQANQDFYNDLCKYMSSSQCLCVSCYKDCDNPVKDMKKLKDKVRNAWGKDDMRNAMHSSDSLDNVNREQKLIFS